MKQIIPAAPDFYVLKFYGKDEFINESVDRIPLIGWLIENSNGDSEYINIKAITPSGVISKDVSILAPNGEVTDQWGEIACSYEQWLQIARNEHEISLIDAGERQQ